MHAFGGEVITSLHIREDRGEHLPRIRVLAFVIIPAVAFLFLQWAVQAGNVGSIGAAPRSLTTGEEEGVYVGGCGCPSEKSDLHDSQARSISADSDLSQNISSLLGSLTRLVKVCNSALRVLPPNPTHPIAVPVGSALAELAAVAPLLPRDLRQIRRDAAKEVLDVERTLVQGTKVPEVRSGRVRHLNRSLRFVSDAKSMNVWTFPRPRRVCVQKLGDILAKTDIGPLACCC